MDAQFTGTNTINALVIGMGIGSLYQKILLELNYNVVTVDINADVGADFSTVDLALEKNNNFDLAFICTPNYTHELIARQLVNHCKIIFIEKPGFQFSNNWISFAEEYPCQRFMMVKNNQWRSNFSSMAELAKGSRKIDIAWINRDRIPKPGSWFTDKKKAWGGVSRDLLPHLLSIFVELNPAFQDSCKILKKTSRQRWRLSDIESSDYGEVSSSGIYNVDDTASLFLWVTNKQVSIRADWRSLTDDNVSVTFTTNKGVFPVNLGLCPEEAYKNMILSSLANYENTDFWQKQLRQDIWIHQIVEKFR